MDLTVTRQQFDAIRTAKHLPDVLKKVLDKATKASRTFDRTSGVVTSFVIPQ